MFWLLAVPTWPCCGRQGTQGEIVDVLALDNDADDGLAAGLQGTKGEVVDKLGALLVEAGMQNVLPLPKARVPVVKFVVG